MAARRRPPELPHRPRSISPKDAILLLRERIQKAEELLVKIPLQPSDLDAWSNTTREVLERSFGSDSPNVSAVIDAQGSVALFVNMSDEEYQEHLTSTLKNRVKMLDSCIEQLEIQLKISPGVGMARPIAQEARVSRRVFLVHGHDHGAKEAVARFLGRLEFEPVILHEQANQGRTLIEKFEDFADVEFAVVILTPDDIGRAATETAEHHRARQNVILELGFFLGKFGRRKVCALQQRGVEPPSDLAGIVYIPFEGEDWKGQLVRELRAAGFTVDANLVV
jgi:predicted nucleotide-binding protein